MVLHLETCMHALAHLRNTLAAVKQRSMDKSCKIIQKKNLQHLCFDAAQFLVTPHNAICFYLIKCIYSVRFTVPATKLSYYKEMEKNGNMKQAAIFTIAYRSKCQCVLKIPKFQQCKLITGEILFGKHFLFHGTHSIFINLKGLRFLTVCWTQYTSAQMIVFSVRKKIKFNGRMFFIRRKWVIKKMKRTVSSSQHV